MGRKKAAAKKGQASKVLEGKQIQEMIPEHLGSDMRLCGGRKP